MFIEYDTEKYGLMKQENFFFFVKDMVDLHNNYRDEARYSLVVPPAMQITDHLINPSDITKEIIA